LCEYTLNQLGIADGISSPSEVFGIIKLIEINGDFHCIAASTHGLITEQT